MWEPWTGTRYPERRTLILGESCYDWDDNTVRYQPQPDHPIMIVTESIEAPDKGATTMVKMTKAICGMAEPTSEQAAQAWSRYAFTNYIPVSVGYGAVRRPASGAWKLAEAEWPNLLARLRPHTVIVLGWTMWSHMPETQKIVSDLIQGYALEDGAHAMCFALRHPSHGGPNWEEYADQIRKAENAHLP